ncbi:LysR family transcriptional regulator [Pigmentiphaga litoralis]|uniref:DNA-binding transcriptional LysR family regulator n=1 Tax=Pigmentiphaga litoralis TaxID=516702 RepID=A0A7Y9IWB8_9BURK|nr:LysR family transcriptional regulator [Pigmentiphaga litoralis]NYE22104.1 DNA-binding transcriptional LysR family regulator [Pigmentiphaga litoralis]NYE84281.1 DNA-binding transcriptional LysR family regulator [Pigmentiphaga litoralis]
MARLDINRSGEMEVFVRAIELGGFSAAARACGMTPSAVSKLVARLEHRLGTRLVNRSTRQLQLTPEGCVFYERSVRILADLNEAERCASTDATPRGKLRVNANVPFGHRFLLPLVPAFVARYPDVTLDIVLTDEVVDILEERTDVAVRAGPMKNSNLLARKLGATRMVIVGAPIYLERCGTPATPDDLLTHNRLGANYARVQSGWPLEHRGVKSVVPVSGNVQVSDGEALHRLAVAGLGLARLAAFQVRDDIAAGRLVPVMEECNPGDLEEIHAVYVGQGGHVPLRVRALLDFLVEAVKIR